MDTIKCYRFVKEDLTSVNGETDWEIEKWNKIEGKIEICSRGFHASLTPIDSLKNNFGTRMFYAEARGELVIQNNIVGASEMRLMKEIPKEVLQKYAIWCAKDVVKYYEQRYPNDTRVYECIQAVENFISGKIDMSELMEKRKSLVLNVGGSAGRAVATVIAAVMA